MDRHERTDTGSVPGWTTDTKLVREFERPVDVADAVASTVDEAIEEWPELSETPPLYHFVDVEDLDGLFRTDGTEVMELPSVAFGFQDCRVTVLYGPTTRVIVHRDL